MPAQSPPKTEVITKRTKHLAVQPNDPAFIDLTATLQTVRETILILSAASEAIGRKVRAHELSVDERITANAAQLSAHINAPDRRPRFVLAQNKDKYTVAFNDQLYTFGYAGQLADEDKSFHWKHEPDGELHSAPSNFACLVEILRDYCNKPVDAPPTG